MSGAAIGRTGTPLKWLNEIWEWPWSISFMRKFAVLLVDQQSSETSGGGVDCFWPAIVLRNVIFIRVILIHGFRRLGPPY
jgi:hypothetical protein